MDLFDLHCDTLYEMHQTHQSLQSNTLHISLEKAACYAQYIQIMAIWSKHDLPEAENYDEFLDIYQTFLNNLDDTTAFCKTGLDLQAAMEQKKKAFFLAVEGGRLLHGDIEKVTELYNHGVRFLTLVWKDQCCMGGAYNTTEGLTPFGKQVVQKCFELGIIPDVSHASRQMVEEVSLLSIAQKRPFIATHSNSYSIMPHPRNLTDEHFCKIKQQGGIVGISLAPQHLAEENASIRSVIRHMEHYLSLGGESTICFGCDFDGVSNLPDGIAHVSDLLLFADEFSKLNYPNALIENIFYRNAQNFIFHWLST